MRESGEEIKAHKTVNDLGVMKSTDVSFVEHIDNLVQSSMIKVGLLLRIFKIREALPMMKMFSSYIQSKLDFCSLIWNPHKKEDFDKIENIQRNFTSKIRGLEHMDYHERLKELGLYSLERRRE